MNNWLKYTLSAVTGFMAGAGTASQSGAGTKGVLIGGGMTAALTILNLFSSSPSDKAKLEKADEKAVFSPSTHHSE